MTINMGQSTLHTFSAAGKLLLFGEYLVLRESNSLAIPIKFGQTLTVTPILENELVWESKEEGQPWFFARFSDELELLETSDADNALKILSLIQSIKNLQPTHTFTKIRLGWDTNFNRQFGFGTSSTLISLLSQWSGVDAYTLLEHSFGGSGYDIAAATAVKPFVYNRIQKITDFITLSPKITDNLLFIYLGQKQHSSKEIAKFKNMVTSENQITRMNTLIRMAKQCDKIEDWERLMQESEQLLSPILGVLPVQERLFQDYPYAVKSLGAWGGDFVMATSRDFAAAKLYFKDKGYSPVLSYNELIR